MKKIGLLILLIFTSTAFSQTAQQELKTRIQAIRSYSAAFTQTVKVKNRPLIQSSGNMAMVRPGHFRWQTNTPNQQLLLADGQHFSVYDADLEQVTIRRQKRGVGGIAGLFLNNYNDASMQQFSVNKVVKGSSMVFDLRSKSKKNTFQQVKLYFNGARLTGIDLLDQLGQWTQIRLSHVKMNTALSANLFQLKVPHGVDVIRQ